LWEDQLLRVAVALTNSHVVKERKTLMLLFGRQSEERADEVFVRGEERVPFDFLRHKGQTEFCCG
jgi:hypothetical protein